MAGLPTENTNSRCLFSVSGQVLWRAKISKSVDLMCAPYGYRDLSKEAACPRLWPPLQLSNSYFQWLKHYISEWDSFEDSVWKAVCKEDAPHLFLVEYGKAYIIRAQKSCKSRSRKTISLSLKIILKKYPSAWQALNS